MEQPLSTLLSSPSVGKLAAAIIAVVAVLAVSRLVQRSIVRHFEDVDDRYRARKVVTLLGYVLACLAVAAIFSDSVGGSTVAFGVAGAGVAFALQEVIASIAGWIAISLGGFYAPGDRVQLGHTKGDVVDISMLRTTLMEVGEWVAADLYTGRIVRVPNSLVFKERVINYSGDFPFLWDEIIVPIRYGTDWRLARQVLRGVADETFAASADQVREAWERLAHHYRVEDTTVEPTITLRATDNWIEFTFRYVVDFRNRRWMKDHLFTRILEEIDKSEGRIQLASATFELVAGSALDVQIVGNRDGGS